MEQVALPEHVALGVTGFRGVLRVTELTEFPMLLLPTDCSASGGPFRDTLSPFRGSYGRDRTVASPSQAPTRSVSHAARLVPPRLRPVGPRRAFQVN